MKTCTKCGEEKPVQAFYLTRYRTPESVCKLCHKARNRANYAAKYGAASTVPSVALHSPRTCTRCAEIKTAADFGRVKNSPDGLRRECKVCRVAREQARYAANAAAKRLYGREWNARNRDALRAGKAARKTAVKQATPLWLTAIQRAQVAEFYDIALARTTQTGVAHEVDHIYPIKGTHSRGLHVPWNLQVLTAAANNTKRRRLPPGVTNKAEH
jgi:hypothetical protein